jgi:hypothetical protein
MNMKKVIAGVFAGAVAISAVATTMASAKAVSYAAIDQTFDLKASGYKAAAATVEKTVGFAKDEGTQIKKEVTPSTATVNGVTIKALDGIAYTIGISVDATMTNSGIKVETTGTTITLKAKSINEFTDAAIQNALNLYKADNFVVTSDATRALADADSFALTGGGTTIITPVTKININSTVSSSDELKIMFDQKIKNVGITFDAAASNNGDITLKEEKADEDDNDFIDILPDEKTVVIKGITLPVDSYLVTFKYDVQPISDKTYKYKSEAQKANPDTTPGLTITTTAASDSIFGVVKNNAASFTKKVEFKVSGSDNSYPEFAENEKVSLAGWTGNITSGVYRGEDIVDAISETIEGRLKAQVIFNFSDPKWDNDGDVYATVWFDTKDFGILKKTVKVDTSNWTAAFNWSDFVKSATSGTSTLGDISNKLDDIYVMVDAKDANSNKIALKSITVKGPAETSDILSAGESVADTTAAITSATEATTTAAATEATTTAAASNPKTGNAPVALAVIPVAIAAAAIIAKKRG